jgi:putative Mg2+ transporter-C (MgtC) family protein
MAAIRKSCFRGHILAERLRRIPSHGKDPRPNSSEENPNENFTTCRTRPLSSGRRRSFPKSILMFLLPGQQALTSLSFFDACFRVLLAAIFGGVLGYNRERVGQPAGLRTHIMVTLGAALFVLVGVELLMEYADRVKTARLDPTRVLQGVVGGIGFLGAGSIIQGRGRVEGITTASSVWVTGAIGAACGLGFYSLAALVTASALLTLTVLARLEPASSDASSAKNSED